MATIPSAESPVESPVESPADICVAVNTLVRAVYRQPGQSALQLATGGVICAAHWSWYAVQKSMLQDFSAFPQPTRTILLALILPLRPYAVISMLSGHAEPYHLVSRYMQCAATVEALYGTAIFLIATYPFIMLALNFEPYKQINSKKLCCGGWTVLISVIAAIPMLDAVQSSDIKKYGKDINYLYICITMAANSLIALPDALGSSADSDTASDHGTASFSAYVFSACLLFAALLPAALSAHAVFDRVALQIVCSISIMLVLAIPLFKPMLAEIQCNDTNLYARLTSSAGETSGARLFYSFIKLAANLFYTSPNLFYVYQFFCKPANSPEGGKVQCQHIEWLYAMMLVTYCSSLLMNIYLLEGLLQQPLQDLCTSIQQSKATCISIWSKAFAERDDVEQQAEVKLLPAA